MPLCGIIMLVVQRVLQWHLTQLVGLAFDTFLLEVACRMTHRSGQFTGRILARSI